MHENLQQLFLSPEPENKLLALQLCKSQGLEEEFKYYRYVFYLFGICSHAEFEFSGADKWIARLDTYYLEDEYANHYEISKTEAFLEEIYTQASEILSPEALAQGSPVFDWYEFLNTFMEITLLGASYVCRKQAESKVSLPILRKSIEAWAHIQDELPNLGTIRAGTLHLSDDSAADSLVGRSDFLVAFFCPNLSQEGLKILASIPMIGTFNFCDVLIEEIPEEFAQASQIIRVDFSIYSNKPIKGLEHLKHILYTDIFIQLPKNSKSWVMGEEWAALENLQHLCISCDEYEHIHVDSLSAGIIQKNVKQESFWLTLNLPKNARLPKNIEHFSKIARLDLISFRFKKIPQILREFKNLYHLEIARTSIHYLPDWFCNQPFLRTLKLKNLQLRLLPPQISKFKKLRTLWLDNNNLEQLPEELSQLKELQYLHIPSNNFKTLPAILSKIPSLARLDISNNFLSDWKGLLALPKHISDIRASDCFQNQDLVTEFNAALQQNPDDRF